MPTILFCNNKQVTYLRRQHIHFQHYTHLLRGRYNDNNNYYLELYPTFCYLCSMIVYHGTTSLFDHFDLAHLGEGEGVRAVSPPSFTTLLFRRIWQQFQGSIWAVSVILGQFSGSI